MNDFMKLDIAIEILSIKLAMTLNMGYSIEDEEIQLLLEERNQIYNGNLEVIDKVIKVYGSELKEMHKTKSKRKN